MNSLSFNFNLGNVLKEKVDNNSNKTVTISDKNKKINGYKNSLLCESDLKENFDPNNSSNLQKTEQNPPSTPQRVDSVKTRTLQQKKESESTVKDLKSKAVHSLFSPQRVLSNTDWGTPQKKTLTPRKLRVHHLEHAEIDSEPLQNISKVPMDGKNERSKRILAFRKQFNISSGRNVAYIAFKVNGTTKYIVDATTAFFKPHAEIEVVGKVLKQFKKERKRVILQELFTERKPCEICNRKLQALLPRIPVFYSWEYPSEIDIRKKTEADYRLLLGNLGVRHSSQTKAEIRKIYPDITFPRQSKKKAEDKATKKLSFDNM